MLVDKLKDKSSKNKRTSLSEEQEADADLATAIGVRLMNEPDMQQAIGQLVNSAEPTMAIGQFVGQMVMNIKEKSMQAQMDIDDQVWLAEGGVVDRLIEQASLEAESFGVSLPRGAEAAVQEEVMNVLKLAASSGQGGQPQQQAGSPMVQAPMMVGGGMP